MRTLSLVAAAAVSLAFVAGAAAQSATPNPNPRPPPGLGQPPGPGPGDVVPAPEIVPPPGNTPLPKIVPAPGDGLPGGPSIGAGPEPGTPGAPRGEDKPRIQFTREQQLDQLFTLLAAAPTPQAATAIERRISAIWTKSGSDTVDLLTKWADDAVEAKNFPLALDYLDRIIALKPDFVEGWGKRANVYFNMEDFGHALGDLEHVLALEPRHFGALAGLGTIMHAIGEDAKALIAYRRALEVDPNLDTVKDALEQLRQYDQRL